LCVVAVDYKTVPKIAQDGLLQHQEQPIIIDHIPVCSWKNTLQLAPNTYLSERPFAYKLKYTIVAYELRLHGAEIRIIWTIKQVGSNDNFVKKRNGFCSKFLTTTLNKYH
jgi:hypothetical protein